MLHIRGNMLGFAVVIAAAVVAGFGGFIVKLSDPVVMIAVGVSLIFMDLIIYLGSPTQKGWLTKAELGGGIYFFPV